MSPFIINCFLELLCDTLYISLPLFYKICCSSLFLLRPCRQVEDLTQHINKCEMKINDLYEEGEDLRERLGLDPKEPLDMTEFRKVKQLQHQQDRALNQVLQKEVERLEEERINLKQHIRKLAQKTGQR